MPDAFNHLFFSNSMLRLKEEIRSVNQFRPDRFSDFRRDVLEFVGDDI